MDSTLEADAKQAPGISESGHGEAKCSCDTTSKAQAWVTAVQPLVDKILRPITDDGPLREAIATRIVGKEAAEAAHKSALAHIEFQKLNMEAYREAAASHDRRVRWALIAGTSITAILLGAAGIIGSTKPESGLQIISLTVGLFFGFISGIATGWTSANRPIQ